MKTDFEAYLSSWARQFLAKRDQVRDLIGDAHWLSDGHHKESLIRQFLTQHLPSSLRVKRGFVRPSNPVSRVSKEVDILVSDPARHPLLFAEDDLQIVAPSSVVGHIEVKTKLESRSLKDALASIANIQAVISTSAQPAPVARGIFFSDWGTFSSVSHFVDFLDRHIRESITPDGIQQIDALPTWIATFDRYVAFIVHDQSTASVLIKAFDAGELSAALAYADFFSAISTGPSSSFTMELDDIVQSVTLGTTEMRTILEAK